MSKITITPQIMKSIAKGTIFVATGGYDANFADFFKVVGKTAKSVKVVQIGKKRVSSGNNCMEYGQVVADPSVIESQPKTLRIRAYEWGREINVSFSTESFHSIGSSAFVWSGQPINEYNYH